MWRVKKKRLWLTHELEVENKYLSPSYNYQSRGGGFLNADYFHHSSQTYFSPAAIIVWGFLLFIYETVNSELSAPWRQTVMSFTPDLVIENTFSPIIRMFYCLLLSVIHNPQSPGMSGVAINLKKKKKKKKISPWIHLRDQNHWSFSQLYLQFWQEVSVMTISAQSWGSLGLLVRGKDRKQCGPGQE